MQLSEGEGRGRTGTAEAQAYFFGQAAQARWQLLLLASIPKGLKGTLLAGEQPPLAPLQGHQGGASFPRPPTRGHLSGQAKCLAGLARQAFLRDTDSLQPSYPIGNRRHSHHVLP